ncbi:MAG: hypothetical protein IOB85_03845 [Methylobacterium sp.]|jgi:hypothetical protein|nr:hypothetical protein [Methylobacterium sp.]MCA3654980.1 hypothetical protein [Methylobacterium sp.]MCA3657420.1 hypothetical protein [Methylobacterium sp.]MCA3661748.1 hypothetical protein [Methylobacterium sp.]MCA3662256.1 hypothetical protein [Methylobacterium sp.]
MRQHFLLLLSAILLTISPALAQKKRGAEPPPEKIQYEAVTITAVAGQEILVRRGYALARDCTVREPNRIAVITAPKSGELTEKSLETFPNYPKDNPRSACNSQKIMATYATYKARDDFQGDDAFRFAIVYFDGKAKHFDVKVTVLRGGKAQ